MEEFGLKFKKEGISDRIKNMNVSAIKEV